MSVKGERKTLQQEKIDPAMRIAGSVDTQWATWTVAGAASLEAHSETLMEEYPESELRGE